MWEPLSSSARPFSRVLGKRSRNNHQELSGLILVIWQRQPRGSSCRKGFGGSLLESWGEEWKSLASSSWLLLLLCPRFAWWTHSWWMSTASLVLLAAHHSWIPCQPSQPRPRSQPACQEPHCNNLPSFGNQQARSILKTTWPRGQNIVDSVTSSSQVHWYLIPTIYLHFPTLIEEICGREAYVPISLRFFKLLGIHWN